MRDLHVLTEVIPERGMLYNQKTSATWIDLVTMKPVLDHFDCRFLASWNRGSFTLGILAFNKDAWHELGRAGRGLFNFDRGTGRGSETKHTNEGTFEAVIV